MSGALARRAAPAREPIPQTITEKLAEMGGELWTIALEIANNRLAAEREALETMRQEAEAARQKAASLADQLTRDLDEAKVRIAALEAAQAVANGQADELRSRLAAASGLAATAEARAAELRIELDNAHLNERQARTERDNAREKAAVLRGRLEALESVMAQGRGGGSASEAQLR